ncbi:hypothetical protein BDV25DRAFT_132307 [Aspergillus avenaceus]|uniref:Uncharacterized protein n=1 Tax=Aspergillus avenaceus TaxID=36643 RepID=A0A5N6TLF8_ASPAV|nr:hypothetical protein BDV25DRAFT_132307 [Aspergillus avenaceus]
MLYRPNTLWTWVFFVSVCVEAVGLLFMETIMYTEFQSQHSPTAGGHAAGNALPTFFWLNTLALIYQLLLVYDTLAHQNTFQVIGLAVYSATLCVYNGLYREQLDNALQALAINGAIDMGFRESLSRWFITLISITAIFTLWILFSAWRLYGEFSWVTVQKVKADMIMQRKYLCFQLLISILKFDGFFFLGFILQMITLVGFGEWNDHEFALVITTIPVSCGLLFLTGWVIRHENNVGTMVAGTLHLGLLGFFGWRLALIYGDSWTLYLPAQQSLTFFGGLTVLFAVATIVMIVLCYRNFRQGLRPYISGESKARLFGETFEMERREEYAVISSEMR